jgi:uncharacterized membrane protein
MKVTKKQLALFLMLTALAPAVVFVYGQSSAVDDASTSVHDAYKVLLKADNQGANTTNLAEQLNLALNLTSQAQTLSLTNPQEAQQLALHAQVLAQNVTEQALTLKAEGLLQQPVAVVAIVVSLLSVGVAVYFWGPPFFWKTWLRLRKNYHVQTKTASSQSTKLIVTGEQTCAAILALTILLAFFAVLPFFLPKQMSDKFSELGVLGPNLKLADYPSNVVAGGPFKLNVYVGNQMGKPMYYEVQVKLGDNATDVDPAPTKPIMQFNKVVPNNGTWLFPIDLTLTQQGQNQTVLFELWIYNETTNQNQYHDRWCQIRFNVTSPAV